MPRIMINVLDVSDVYVALAIKHQKSGEAGFRNVFKI
jgi:hypothetical protein